MTKFLTFYDTLNQKEGTMHLDESRCVKDSEQDTNIYALIDKYGVEALMQKRVPEKELYLDMSLFENSDLNTIIENRERIRTYYNELPSKVRKSYADNFDKFYEKLRKGEFDDMIEQGILTEEHVNAIQKDINDKKEQYKQKLINDYILQKEIEKEATNGANGSTGNSELENG